ncbi:MAG TPA: asparagine synthase-related protein, partial [Planctomycetota bacterium]|nr:asparagine synthase-related protein [Planctomycetota bacterium]
MNRAALDALLRARRSLLVAFSGGVDSSALLVAAVRALGRDRVLAITADSASYPEADRRDAAALAAALGVEHVFVRTRELEKPAYVANAPDRCWHCKTELFDVLEPIRAERGIEAIAYGEIA